MFLSTWLCCRSMSPKTPLAQIWNPYIQHLRNHPHLSWIYFRKIRKMHRIPTRSQDSAIIKTKAIQNPPPIETPSPDLLPPPLHGVGRSNAKGDPTSCRHGSTWFGIWKKHVFFLREKEKDESQLKEKSFKKNRRKKWKLTTSCLWRWSVMHSSWQLAKAQWYLSSESSYHDPWSFNGR